ncbi:hypothetical protein LJC23_05060 [Desulfovibrio sp. OttesenSCG-928-I05]|nr:hypothetical protein [Desulfovibrio sp. OttesenSCG-928-I05]
MLLKICDPDYELPVLNDYSVGFSFTSVTGFVLLPVIVNFMLFSSFTTVLLFLTALLAIAAVVLVGADRISRRV